ncbi:MAG TPA: HNH endonuclease [Pyrinomonadaceae bacterium]|nr:HNH endonuclease [Pyrinomonadaceae bacterium]
MITGRVLLLNFSYEPLGTIGVARAMCLTLRGAATTEELDGANVIRTVRQTFQVPSVVRLRRYVHIRRGRQAAATVRRAQIYMRDGYRCQYCGNTKAAAVLTLDHILPRAQGGTSAPENLVTACERCNQRKGNRTPEQARMPLLTSQTLLKVGLDRVLLCRYAESKPEWKKYLFIEDEAETQCLIA